MVLARQHGGSIRRADNPPDLYAAQRALWPLLTSVRTSRVTPVAPPFRQALLTGTRHRSPRIRT